MLQKFLWRIKLFLSRYSYVNVVRNININFYISIGYFHLLHTNPKTVILVYKEHRFENLIQLILVKKVTLFL